MPFQLFITGRTWAFRRDLTQLGGRWNPRLGAWLVPAVRRAEILKLAAIADIDVDVFDATTGTRVPVRLWSAVGQ